MAKTIPTVVNSFAALGENMGAFSDRFRNNVAVMAVKSGLVAVEEVAVRTPVDTSEARSNWSLDTAKVTVVRPPFTSGRHQGIGERAALGAVLSQARRSGRSISREHILSGKSLWVSNPVQYIGALNAGSSPQNPQGDFDVIAAQLVKGFVESYVRSGKLLTIVDSV